MKLFFAEKKISIEYEVAGAPVGKPQVVFMRPLKVNELPRLLKFVERRKAEGVLPFGYGEPADFIEMLEIVGATVEGINGLPSAVLTSIIDIFFEYNFPNDDEVVAGYEPEEGFFFTLMQFLISKGHHHAEIMEYTLPQFRGYIEKYSAGTKKQAKVDPFEALAALGIPVCG